MAGAAAEVAWASVADSGTGTVFVDLGLRYGTAVLKTRWTVEHTPRGLDDRGHRPRGPRHLARRRGRAAARARARPPARRGREARARALPRARRASLAILAIVARLRAAAARPERRRLLWLTAAVPALLFLVDGALAVRRALSEPYALAESLPPQPWRQLEKLALAAQQDGQDARPPAPSGSKAIEAGAPAGPVDYQMGLAARARGDAGARPRSDFERALARSAAGAGRRQGARARSALADGPHWPRRAPCSQRYLRRGRARPRHARHARRRRDQPRRHRRPPSRRSQAARALVGESWQKAELEAAASTPARATRRPPWRRCARSKAEGRLDRAVLRADPAYLPIATDPAWVAFLAEPTTQPK